MIRAEDTALLLLAAGHSERFVDADKLAEPFLGQPLAFHVVTALEAVPFAARVAVVSGTSLDFGARGYRTVENPVAGSGQGRSLALGVGEARLRGVKAILVALADMPRVTAAHIWRLLDAGNGPDTVLASSDGTRPMPPALFGANHFDTLAAGGDRDHGARELIARGHHVVTSPAELVDIDTRADLDALRKLYGAGRRH